MRNFTLVLLAVTTVSTMARAESCSISSKPDMGGDKVYNEAGAEVGPPMTPDMNAKLGSLFLPSGVAMAIYPGTNFRGDAYIVSTRVSDNGAAFKKVPGGSYINLADLYDSTIGGYTALDSDLRSFYCFEDGTFAAANSSFFRHQLKTVYPGETLTANANEGYSTSYEATLANEGSSAVLNLSVTPFLPHGGQATHYTVNFGTGEVHIDREANGSGYPASHNVYTAKDLMSLKGAVAEVRAKVEDMVHLSIVPILPVAQLKEVDDLFGSFLGQ